MQGVDWSVGEKPHIDGIYYDGINYDRRSMRRIRKVMDQAAKRRGAKQRPYIDFHTGNQGVTSPSAVSYLSHFPYADSAWNGEGFQWDSHWSYWLVDVSGFIHGIPADRLGGPDDIKGMLFGTYERNHDPSDPKGKTPQVIWKLWDAYNINTSTMIGWWESDAAVTAVDASAQHKNHTTACTDAWGMTKNSWILSSGGQEGVYAFGHECGSAPQKIPYPKMTVQEAKKTCCDLADECVGFSWDAKVDVLQKGAGCLQKHKSGMAHGAGFNGYEKQGHGGTCNVTADVKATTFVNHGVNAIIVVASWCTSASNVTLKIDWSALGLEQASSKVIQPAMKGIQKAADHGDGSGQLTIGSTSQINSGAILVVTKR